MLLESRRESMACWACLIERTAGPIPGMFLQASSTFPVNYSMNLVIKAGLFCKELGLFPPMYPT